MKLRKSAILCALPVFVMGLVVAHAMETSSSLSEPMTQANLSEVFGGTCYTDGTTDCPATSAKKCTDTVVCKVKGDSCFGTSYSQSNKTYPTVKDATKGFSGSAPPKNPTLCGDTENCGPTCTIILGSLICPFTSTTPDSKIGTIPDSSSTPCGSEFSLERPTQPGERMSLFANSGGLADMFTW